MCRIPAGGSAHAAAFWPKVSAQQMLRPERKSYRSDSTKPRDGQLLLRNQLELMENAEQPVPVLFGQRPDEDTLAVRIFRAIRRLRTCR